MECIDYALRYISRFPKTEKELVIKLYQKWYGTVEVQKVIDDFKKKGYVDDQKFSESYLRSDVINKGKPLLTLTKKLQMKWVDKEIIKKIVVDFEEEIDEWIRTRIKKEIEAYKRKWVDWFDIIQKLMRKWYKLDDIKYVIEKYKPNK